MIFLQLLRHVAVINGNPERCFKPVRTQVAEGVDPFEPSSIRKVKGGDGVGNFAILACLRQIRECKARQWRCKYLAASYWLFKQQKKCFDGIAASCRLSQSRGVIGEQRGEPAWSKTVFILSVRQGP